MARTLRHPAVRLPLPARPANAAGAATIAVGLATCLAGMERFTGPRELTGTRNQALTTSGIYRYSRYPQYVGHVTVLAGAALTQRSGTALAWTGAMAAAYAAWIPVEENHLRQLHGRTYDNYWQCTNRWWGVAARGDVLAEDKQGGHHRAHRSLGNISPVTHRRTGARS